MDFLYATLNQTFLIQQQKKIKNEIMISTLSKFNNILIKINQLKTFSQNQSIHI